jgi:hypothetical protein
MRFTIKKSSSVCARYRRRVTEQVYQQDGKPFFSQNEIGKWSTTRTTYFDNVDAYHECLHKWSSQHPWEYQVLSIAGVNPIEIPKGSRVIDRSGRIREAA